MITFMPRSPSRIPAAITNHFVQTTPLNSHIQAVSVTIPGDFIQHALKPKAWPMTQKALLALMCYRRFVVALHANTDI